MATYNCIVNKLLLYHMYTLHGKSCMRYMILLWVLGKCINALNSQEVGKHNILYTGTYTP